MTDFHTFHIVTARKSHRCEQCGADILAGEKYRRCAQVWEGDFHAYCEHIDCHNAWYKLNFEVRGLCHDEGAIFLRDDDHEHEDREWMREEYPLVAARLGWRDAA